MNFSGSVQELLIAGLFSLSIEQTTINIIVPVGVYCIAFYLASYYKEDIP